MYWVSSMLSWVIERGVIKELIIRGKNIILPWGIETADASGFYSLEENIGYRNKRNLLNSYSNDNSSFIHESVSMPEGSWELKISDSIRNNSIVRSATLTSIEDTILMDYVMRFRFKKEYFDSANIAGKTIYHTASDVYHLYPVQSARLNGSDITVHIEIESADCANIMSPNIYVRDHADEWVVHVRMLPQIVHKEVIKICNGWAGTRAIPQWLSNSILSVSKIRSYLLYRNERNPYPRIVRRLLNLNAFPMAMLPEGRSLHWTVKMSVV